MQECFSERSCIGYNGLAVWFCKPATPLQSNNKLSKGL